MNGKTLKRIKKIARQLPASIYEAEKKSIVKGGELLKKDIDEVEGEEVILGQKYVFSETALFYINHVRRLKRAYKKNGEKGIADYIRWFTRHHTEMMRKYPHLFKNKQNVGVS